MPPMLYRKMWDDAPNKSHLPDQHFGQVVSTDDLVDALAAHQLRRRQHGVYNRPWHHSGAIRDTGSNVHAADDKFEINLDVAQFKPEEVSVKLSGHCITVEGKHEEKEDDHGVVMRQFVRRYTVPEGHDLDRIGSSLSSDGVLTVTVQKTTAAEPQALRDIPVVQTGEPAHLTSDRHMIRNGNGVS
ncbi:protein lethal(2)essential for life-like [Aedes aegypti]|uniref:Alpha-B-crystallin, putative n=1 Tax=Aedes aegypti TaxID=7159 RepID=A0A1S4FQY8_AEDAE|nr:protein lethal(2)essential for life [Aedes aegypti]XP_021698196.1 protein lethal(2)essential for life-like [Aedes aegypti]